MRVLSIDARPLAIPFKAAFRHASAERAATQTLWVEVRTAGGEAGYGEGCPREYVTAESVESALAFCAAHGRDWGASIHDLAALKSWGNEHAEEIERNPAAWAAVELAFLDAIGKTGHRSVEAILGLPRLTGCFHYTAVLGDASPAQFEAQLARYLEAGFRDFKVKLSGDAVRDKAKARALARAGLPGDAVRADANNVWDSADAAIRDLAALDFSFRALEEPLRAGDYAGMSRIAQALKTSIILDESAIRADQLDRVGDRAGCWIVNLRVSKMGGLLRSLAFVSELRRRHIGLIIGAHVGETSVLARAALTVANVSRDILVAQEGAFGTHLVARDVADPPVMFGAGGVLDADALDLGDTGFGLSIIDVPQK